jgi:uncharacterized LabA/DUF88 family protein
MGSTFFILYLAHFRFKHVWSHTDQSTHLVYEEKETDVALACHVMAMASQDLLDTAVLVSGDSDFAPLCRTFQEVFPSKKLIVLFPYDRVSKDLRKCVRHHLKISKEMYVRNQLPSKIKLPSKKFVTIPDHWVPKKSS